MRRSRERAGPPPDTQPEVHRAQGPTVSACTPANPRSLSTLWASPDRETTWDVIVVGTGYGGAAAAAELAGRQIDDDTSAGGRRPLRLLVLERGRTYRPGDFPATLGATPGHVRLADTRAGTTAGQDEGLFDLRPGNDVVALVANGMGGGSLINAGVMLEPDPDELRRPDFATLVREMRDQGGFAQARRLLGGTRWPASSPAASHEPSTIAHHPTHRRHPLRKALALSALGHAARSAGRGDSPVEVPITVAMEPTKADHGATLPACTLCGDCMTGCNVGAKRSLDTTLLARAMQAGAQIITGASVESLQPVPRAEERADTARWALSVRHTRRDLQARERGPLTLRARHVILAAGTLGSTEILLRARGLGLALSPRLGERFSCNGDNLAAVHRMRQPVNGAPHATQPLDARDVGPTITSAVKMRPRGAGARPYWLQEFAVPAALRWLFDEAVTTGHALAGLAGSDRQPHGGEEASAWDPLAVAPDAMARTLLVGLIGHDDAGGVLTLAQPMAAPAPAAVGTLRIHWPQARHGTALDAAMRELDATVRSLRTADAHGRTGAAARDDDGPHLVPNPMWRAVPASVGEATGIPPGPVLTVHPLGGCPIGTDSDTGVVDHAGQVYDGASVSRHDVHHGLAVLDGAIVPESLGANPSLTITALARRGALHLADAWGLHAGTGTTAMQTEQAEVAAGDGPADRGEAAPGPTTATAAMAGAVEGTTNGATDGTTQGMAAKAIAGAADAAAAPPAAPSTAPSGSTPAPTPTCIEITERLTGQVTLTGADGAPGRWVMELTLAYRPLALERLSGPLARRLEVEGRGRGLSRVRLYDAIAWEDHGLAGLDDLERQAHAAFDAEVEGSLELLHREASSHLGRRFRALAAWQRHRGWRDIFQSISEGLGRLKRRREAGGTRTTTLLADAPAGARKLRARITELWAMASLAGEVRRFDYRLRVGPVSVDRLGWARRPDGEPGPWACGAPIEGCKRLGYAIRPSGRLLPRAGNPWRQLTELTLTRLPQPEDGPPAHPLGRGKPARRAPAGLLVLDTRFLARREAPLLRIVAQTDQVGALADLASFGLMLMRMLVRIHLWTFRKPDTTRQPVEPVSLPQSIDGLPAPQVTELVVDHDPHDRSPVVVRLTRYPQCASRPGADDGPPPPALVMIHGYSVSGNTFTHASIRPPAAAWFHARGRDVWVVDLRTSTGLPTATRPWTMEQVAWIDIPAALVHVRRATGGPVDVLAHCIGCVMLSMALLARPDELQAEARYGDRPDPLTPGQRATLTDFNSPPRQDGDGPAKGSGAANPHATHATHAANPANAAEVAGDTRAATRAPSNHPTVRRLVLSQKGPVLRYTDANVLRGWLMQFLRRWLLPQGLQFRPSNPPGTGEQLLDRLLASLPYPDADWAVENPWQPWRRTPWTATRHRMDMLYGRDFEAAGLRRPTLEAIDDLFGPMHLDTLAQTVHFTRLDMAADACGQGRVTGALLRERWAGIPTLALHGGVNGLVDVWTQRLLAAWLVPAGVPFQARTYKGMGHQDLLIGRDAARVFADVEAFLADRHAPRPVPGAPPRTPATSAVSPQAHTAPSSAEARSIPAVAAFGTPSSASSPAAPPASMAASDAGAPDQAIPVALTAPWLGPRIDIERSRKVRVAAMPGPVAGPGRLVLLPLRRDATGALALDPEAAVHAAPCEDGPRRWQFAEPNLATAGADAPTDLAACGGAAAGWVAVIAHHPAQIAPARLGFGWPGMQGAPTAEGGWLAPLPAGSRAPSPPARLRDAPLWQEAAEAWVATLDAEALDAAHVPLSALAQLHQRLGPACRPEPLRVALASCQYPHGPLDALPAQAALNAMATQARRGEIDLALMLGDQIYADATAGLVDPTTLEERYVQPYERAFGAAGMRRLLASVPAFMVPDDHELVDNWEPPPAHGGHDAALWDVRARSAHDGRWAYWRHARLRDPDPRATQTRPRTADKAFRFAGVPCFVLDTRLGRSARGGAIDDGPPPRLISAHAWMRLESWLLRHRDTLKIVACPSMLLPRRREVVDEPTAAARCDGWDGYPTSRDRLMDLLARRRIGQTLFVSGDEHHSLACKITLRAAGYHACGVTALSVHSSALYAPFPFANGKPSELSDASFLTRRGTAVSMVTTPAPPGDGFGVLTLPNDGQPPSVTWFRAAGGGRVDPLPF